MSNFKHTRRAHRVAGITMVESLVALVVISVGMLGIAGMYLMSLQAGRSANLRVQAVNLASELADRIRSNRQARAAYNLALGGTPAAFTCDTATCSAANLASNDLNVWLASLRAALPAGATATVQYTDNARPVPNRYEIRVIWREAGSDTDSSYLMVLEL